MPQPDCTATYCVPSIMNDDGWPMTPDCVSVLPQHLAGGRIEGAEHAVVGAAAEDQSAAGGQHRPPVRRLRKGVRPDARARVDVPRLHFADVSRAGRDHQRVRGAGVALARRRRRPACRSSTSTGSRWRGCRSSACPGCRRSAASSCRPNATGRTRRACPVPGCRAGSTLGRPLFGSRLAKTLCFTYGLPSTKLMRPFVRSRNQR